MDLGIKGKRALVFASSTGLGKAVARELVLEGVETVISSRSLEKLKDAAEDIGTDHYLQCDFSRRESAAELVKAVQEKLGGIDILVTNAGGPPAGAFFDFDDAQWERSFQELFLSVAQAVRQSAGTMKEQSWGRIVMLTSVAGKEPVHNLTLSNALRAGVHGLMKTLSKELGPDGITVNAVLPTYTDTDRLRQLKVDPKKMTAQIPVGRLGRPEELGKLVAFLCSEHAGFISGQALGFDGGALQAI